MKVIETYNSYSKEDFLENKKFSCHNWVIKCIENINISLDIIEKNKYQINDKDLVGKFNTLNFTIDVFSFYQNTRFRDYPINRDYELDFAIILYGLLKNDGNILSYDYRKETVRDNLNKFFKSENDISWKNTHKFINPLIFDMCNSENPIEQLKLIMKDKDTKKYLLVSLQINLENNHNQIKKLKI